ncbi:MAG: pantoate--beta-alanine ligase [Solirubrobacteraceae bacterium]|nr:pantoate--beta-alanine ligase [Solirubrobacteraceae bacterium]
MRTIRTVRELRAHVRQVRAAGRTIGLVPTMGALHDGHLSLVATSVADADETIVSLFVNPRQFGDAGDLEHYPRDEARDAALAADAGAHVLFAPPVDEVYPDGFGTEVRVSGPLTERLEGAHRGAAHFHGVTTVVTKLLNMVQPDVAFFGAKDAQQVLVVRRLVRDLDLPVRIETVATVREDDGLARSSRNLRLSPEDRRTAGSVPRALQAAIDAWSVTDEGADAGPVRDAAVDALHAAGLDPEYVALVDPGTLGDVAALDGPALLAVAVPVGPVRLIDNVLLDRSAPAPRIAPGPVDPTAGVAPLLRTSVPSPTFPTTTTQKG